MSGSPVSAASPVANGGGVALAGTNTVTEGDAEVVRIPATIGDPVPDADGKDRFPGQALGGQAAEPMLAPGYAKFTAQPTRIPATLFSSMWGQTTNSRKLAIMAATLAAVAATAAARLVTAAFSVFVAPPEPQKNTIL